PTGAFSQLLPGAIPLSQSLAGGMNLWLYGLNALTILGINLYLAKFFAGDGDVNEGHLPELGLDKKLDEDRAVEGQKLDHSFIPLWGVALAIGIYMIRHFLAGG